LLLLLLLDLFLPHLSSQTPALEIAWVAEIVEGPCHPVLGCCVLGLLLDAQSDCPVASLANALAALSWCFAAGERRQSSGKLAIERVLRVRLGTRVPSSSCLGGVFCVFAL
jgi:hypothetical protein